MHIIIIAIGTCTCITAASSIRLAGACINETDVCAHDVIVCIVSPGQGTRLAKTHTHVLIHIHTSTQIDDIANELTSY